MSGHELELRDQELEETATFIAAESTIVVPLTGELIDLYDLNRVAGGIEQVRDLKRQLDELRGLLERVLRLRSRELGTKTLHLDGVDVTISGGSRLEYDLELLAQRLRAGGLPESRLERLIVATVTYKIDHRVARELRGANPAYAAALAEARRDVPAPWRVTVRRHT
jgi:hypothetical protein